MARKVSLSGVNSQLGIANSGITITVFDDDDEKKRAVENWKSKNSMDTEGEMERRS